MIFRLLLPIALALLSGCSFDSAAAAPANCTLQYLDGKAPLIPEKQRSKSREICYSSFAALHSGVSRTALWSAEFLSKDRIGSARKIERTSETFDATQRPVKLGRASGRERECKYVKR